MLGDRFGTHRVLEPPGALPQPAWRVDADPEKTYETEIVVDVETLNVDAASFRQMEEEAGGDPERVGAIVLRTVRDRGKQHNPVTGSGGMLLGRVTRVGEAVAERGFAPGDRVATLASLSLTPLSLRAIRAIRPASAQIDVEGTAIVFASAPLAKLAADFPERLALALYDVAGAAPQAARIVAEGDVVVVLGAGGKSGLLVCAEARRRAGARGRVVGIESHAPFAADLEQTGLCDAVASVDARDPLAVRAAVLAATGGREADASFSCVNVPGVELAAVLATRDRGKVYFFAMSTSFTAAALGAEGVGKDVDMFIGNGFAEGHAEHTLDLVRRSPALGELLARRYA
jgi:L-erythro-3,5-diaminohexanoate dehydrogenase